MVPEVSNLWTFIKARAGIIIGMVVFGWMLFDSWQNRPSITFSDRLVEPVLAAPGEWTSMSFGFEITRPECRFADDEPLRIILKPDGMVPLPVHHYAPPEIRPADVTEQRRSIYSLAFEVPAGAPGGLAKIHVKGVRVCSDRFRLVESTPTYEINIVTGLDDGGQ